jgi:engulfment and cell motility protein 1
MSIQPPSSDLTPSILSFQSSLISFYHNLISLKLSPDDPQPRQVLENIFQLARISEDYILEEVEDFNEDEEESDKWKLIGFETRTPIWEFEECGILGLRTMKGFCEAGRGEEFTKVSVFCDDDFRQYLSFVRIQIILEQLARPPERRCPFAKACLEVVEILADLFEFNTGVSITSTNFLPFSLSFQRVHNLALKFVSLDSPCFVVGWIHKTRTVFQDVVRECSDNSRFWKS